MKNIYLLRHTESEKNLKIAFGDIKNPFSLTDKGQTHAMNIGVHINENIANNESIAIFNSSSRRAIETAQIIANVLKIGCNTVDLFSVNSGNFGGKTYEEQALLFPEFNEKEKKYCNGLLSGLELIYPNGESMVDFQNRIIAKFENIVTNSNKNNIFVVCHQSVIGAILNKYKRMKRFEYEFLHTDLGHFAKLELKENEITLLIYNSKTLPTS